MTTAAALDDLQARILAGFHLLFLKTWEEGRWEQELSRLSRQMGRLLVVWTSSSGPQPPPAEADAGGLREPQRFLEQIGSYSPNRLFLLKDFHPYLKDPRVVRQLRDLLSTLSEQRHALLLIGPDNAVPLELQKDAAAIDLPLPDTGDLRRELAAALQDSGDVGLALRPTSEEEGRLLTAVTGLTSAQAYRALSLVLGGRNEIDDDVFKALIAEKKSLLQGSRLLEFYPLQEGVNDIGGLGELKTWLAGRAHALNLEARHRGIPMPKGVFLLGVQGCGKSLTARATARLLSVPLVRLDISRLLCADRGVSEQNMREVLMIAESMAPIVLWLDEIEKGFAGSTAEDGYDATMSRLIGQFLIWMEEKTSPVFVVATANSIANLPPELLRRGRFDEMFFIDLPNFDERRQILEVHLRKQGLQPDDFDVARLAERTADYSGAELAQIVQAAATDAYVRGEAPGQNGLEEAQERTVPLSVTMEEKVFALREWAKDRCRWATPDSRVAEMLERDRQDDLSRAADGADGKQNLWRDLAGRGKIREAVCRYVGSRPPVTFPELQEALAGFLETAGDHGLALRSDPNAVIWMGLNGEFAGMLAKLIRAGHLYVQPVDEDVYAEHAVTLPVVKRLPDEPLSRPGWLPVCLVARPPKQLESRLTRVARVKLSK